MKTFRRILHIREHPDELYYFCGKKVGFSLGLPGFSLGLPGSKEEAHFTVSLMNIDNKRFGDYYTYCKECDSHPAVQLFRLAQVKI